MKNVKVMLATATRELDEPIKKTDGIEIVEEVFYREGILLVLKKILQKSPEALPEVIVISESLEGRLSIEELVKEIRNFDCRIVYLPGMITEMSQFIVNASCLGVVNIMFDPIEVSKLSQLIKSPPAQADVIREWGSRDINVENRSFEEELISRKSIAEHILHADNEDIQPKDVTTDKTKARFRIKTNGKVSAINYSIRQFTKDTIRTVGEILEEKGVETQVPHGNSDKKIVISVWSPSGFFKSFTALNLAVCSKSPLLNFDLACPELDVWFGIRQTGLKEADEKDAGIMTLGDYMNPSLVPRMLREIKWGIRYLPAGNKIGNIGIPDYGDRADELFKAIIAVARNEAATVIIDAGRDIEIPATYAALYESDIIVVPLFGIPQEAEVAYWQLNELARVGINKPTLELVFSDNAANMNKVCQKRIQLNIDLHGYMESSCRAIPYCLLKGEEEWGEILRHIKSS